MKQSPKATVHSGKSTSNSLTSLAEVTPDWLTVVESLFCFVWTGLCLAGGFNPLYPSGAVQQRNLCKPFLGLKPVVTFFSSVFQFHTKMLGLPFSHMKWLDAILLYIVISFINLYGMKKIRLV